MSPFRCFLCFQPSLEIIQEFQVVLRGFLQVFNKFQPCSFDISEVSSLCLCKSCWIDFMQVHKLDAQLSVKNEISETEIALLSLKIRRAQILSQNDTSRLAHCEDLDVQVLAEGNRNHYEKDSEVDGPAQDAGTSIIRRRMCNKSETEPNDLSATADSTSSERSTEELESDHDNESEPQAVENSGYAQLVVAYENKWLPKNFTIPKTPTVVKQISEVDFIYMGKYPFQGTETGFKCGLCATICKFYKRSRIWENINSHIRALHADNRHVGAVKGRRKQTDSDCESQEAEPSALVTSYENKWLPQNSTIPESSPVVKRLSEIDFMYKDKFPFQAIAVGFKCGLCPAICSFYTCLPPVWHNILKHISKWHNGRPRQRNNKILQKFIEVAPNRFQYGKYFVDKIGESYRCGECGVIKPAGTKNKSSHIKVHITEKHERPSRTYVCEYCGTVYQNANSLRVHKMNKHGNPDGQFPCRDCGKIFRSSEIVSRHRIQVHRSQDKFICESCGKGFRKQYALADHVAFVHNGQKIECKDCGKMFASQIALLTHRNSHTGKKFTCDICGMNFTQHYSVTRHKKTAHQQ